MKEVTHTVIVTDPHAEYSVVETHRCGKHLDAAIATYKVLVEEYERDIEDGDFSVTLVANRFNTV